MTSPPDQQPDGNGRSTEPPRPAEIFTERVSTDDTSAPIASADSTERADWSDLILLDFEAGPPFVSTGRVVVDVAIGGDSELITTTTGSTGAGRAARFPPFDEVGGGGSAAVVVRGDDRDLEIGRMDFRLRADVSLDARSVGSVADSGNNVVQRGLFTDESQIKIQVDDGRVSCRVAGPEGAVLVRDPALLETETWYGVACARHGDRIVLTVQRLASGDEPARRAEATGRTGSLDWVGTPISIGGKVDGDGDPVGSNFDQYNGAIDNVVLSVRTAE